MSGKANYDAGRAIAVGGTPVLGTVIAAKAAVQERFPDPQKRAFVHPPPDLKSPVNAALFMA